MTPCEKLGYKVGDLFEVIEDETFRKDSVIQLIEDDGTDIPYFKLITGICTQRDDKAYLELSLVKPYKPTNYPDFDFKINLSNMTEAEKKVAREWLVELVESRGEGHTQNTGKSDLLFVSKGHHHCPCIEWVEVGKLDYFEECDLPELKLSFTTSVQSWEIPEKECKKTLQLKELIDKLSTQLEEAEAKLKEIEKETK